jgi:WD40 repeat protein
MPVHVLATPDHDDYRRILGRSVEDVVFSPNGTELVASVGTSVVVWRLSDRSEVTTVPVNDAFGRVNALAFSPDGSVLVTSEGYGTPRFWDPTTWREMGSAVTASSEGRSLRFPSIRAGRCS